MRGECAGETNGDVLVLWCGVVDERGSENGAPELIEAYESFVGLLTGTGSFSEAICDEELWEQLFLFTTPVFKSGACRFTLIIRGEGNMAELYNPME